MKARMNIRSIITVMAIICLASMFFINICLATNTGKITTETVRIREQPNTEAKVLELASLGEEVEILEELNGWYKVKYKKITGYIRNDLVEVTNNTNQNEQDNAQVEDNDTKNTTVETNTETADTTVETNTTSDEEAVLGKRKLFEDVKLRITPLISSIELGEVKKDTEVEVIEVLNIWAKIQTADGKEGWVIRRRTASTGETIVLFMLPETTDSNVENTTTQPEQTTAEAQQETQTTEAQITETQTQQTTKTMYVNSQTVNLRKEANTTSKVLKQLPINKEIAVISNENGWYKVEVDGTTGYISQSLLSDTKQETSRSATAERNTGTQNTNNEELEEAKTENKAETETKSNTTQNTTTSKTEPSITTTSNKGNEVVAYAKQFLGYKYVYGGTTTSGFDCSGFTQYVYKHFGVNLNRTAAGQYSNGTSVTDLQAGDLVMFGKSGINHVGIYIGGNTFIHAANASRGVTTDTLASGYYKTNYVGARRIF